jgi:carbohydrate-selective porin OprB
VLLPERASGEPAPAVEQEAAAQTRSADDVTIEHRWHTARRGAREVARDAVDAAPGDWNPLARPAAAGKAWLRDVGITADLFVMGFYRVASELPQGNHDYGTFAWRTIGDWELVSSSRLGRSYVEWNLNGTVGVNYDEGKRSLSSTARMISNSNANVFPDTSALNELFWKQVSPSGRLVLMAGRVDHGFHFDTNRVANDSFRKLFSFALMNNLSIPWPLYGGLGGLVHWQPSTQLVFRFGAGDSGSDRPWGFWRTADENNWYQLFEAQLNVNVAGLGKGHYRLTPWHNHLEGEDGWGMGVNFDQELGLPWLVAFFRFGTGDEDVTRVKRFVSGGIAAERPFGRVGDYFALGLAWSRPSAGAGKHDETFLEAQYRFRITPTVELSPDLQLVINPAANGDDVIFIPGLRLTLVL